MFDTYIGPHKSPEWITCHFLWSYLLLLNSTHEKIVSYEHLLQMCGIINPYVVHFECFFLDVKLMYRRPTFEVILWQFYRHDWINFYLMNKFNILADHKTQHLYYNWYLLLHNRWLQTSGVKHNSHTSQNVQQNEFDTPHLFHADS